VNRGSLPTGTNERVAVTPSDSSESDNSDSDLDVSDTDDVGGGVSTQKISGSDRPLPSVVSTSKPSQVKQFVSFLLVFSLESGK